MSTRLAIVAGEGALPARLIAACRAQGREMFVLAIAGHADPAGIPADVPQEWIAIREAGRGFDILRHHAVEEVVLAGGVRRPSLSDLIPTQRTLKFLARVGSRALGDDGLLRALIAEIEDAKFRVVSVQEILGGVLARAGAWGRIRPGAAAKADIRVGIAAARELGAADLGQAVLVRAGAVLGREDEAGTDALVRGLGESASGGVLVKAAKLQQDRRADLPAIGPATVAVCAAAKLAGIAVEAGATIVVDEAATIAAADAAGLFLVGVGAE